MSNIVGTTPVTLVGDDLRMLHGLVTEAIIKAKLDINDVGLLSHNAPLLLEQVAAVTGHLFRLERLLKKLEE